MFLLLGKEFSLEGAVVPGLLLCSKLEQSESPGTTGPSIEKSSLLDAYQKSMYTRLFNFRILTPYPLLLGST